MKKINIKLLGGEEAMQDEKILKKGRIQKKIFIICIGICLILLSGCGRSFADLSGNEKLHIGIQGSGLPETMREGIENGADIDQLPLWMGTYDSYGMKYDRNPLRILIAKQNTPYIVEIMLQAGADPNTYDGISFAFPYGGLGSA